MKMFVRARKIVGAALAAVMLVGLAACDKTEPQTTTTDPTKSPATTATKTPDTTAGTLDVLGMKLTKDPVKLSFWHDNDQWAERLTSEFTALYPNVTFELRKTESTDNRGNMEMEGPAGTGADVFLFPHDHMSSAIAAGLVEPAPDAVQAEWERVLDPTAVKTVKKDGKMYGVPYQLENLALIFNKDLWKGDAPKTWEEVLEFANTYDGHAMQWEAANAYQNFCFLAAGGMQLFGPNHDDYTKPGFGDPEAAKGLEYYLRLKPLYNVFTTDMATANDNFATGKAPLTMNGPWVADTLVANKINFGVAKIPTIDGVQPQCFSGVKVAAVSSFSNNWEWAHVFADFIANQQGAKIMYEVRGMRPALADISGIPNIKSDAVLMGFEEQLPYTLPMPSIVQVQQMWGPLGELFKYTWDGGMTIPQAQEKAMGSYRKLIGLAGFDVNF